MKQTRKIKFCQIQVGPTGMLYGLDGEGGVWCLFKGDWKQIPAPEVEIKKVESLEPYYSGLKVSEF